ncbi:MAG: hypothetical protein QGH60_00445 [Phycisphaerae bacterium]|jgi:uncharacterized protein involved in exopolysaccharide biosynthesis|nr:hypothetical protein [Phycisphaerae bacterium]
MRKGLVFGVVLGWAIGGLTGCVLRGSRYTSTAYIGVHPPGAGSLSTNFRNTAIDLDIVKESYVQIAKIQAVLRRAINEDTTEDGRNRDRIRKTSYFTGDLVGTISRLQEELSVASVKDTNLIRISLSGPNPSELPEVVNAVADALVHHTKQRARSRRAAQMKHLKDRLDEIRGQISARQKAIAQIRGTSDVSVMRAKRTSLQMTLQSLTTELTQLKLVKAQATTANERLLTVENQCKEVSGQLRDLGTCLTKIDKLEAEIGGLQNSADQVEKALLQLRIAMDENPLSIKAAAEIPTKPSR